MRICVLGPLRVITADGPVDPGGVRTKATIGWLAARANQRVGFESLASVVWEKPPADAVRRLRMMIGSLAARLPPGVLEIDSAVRLLVADDVVDADQFEKLIDAGYRSWENNEVQQATSAVSDALELWRGKPYPDLAETTAGGAEIDRLERLRADAVELQQESVLAGPIDFSVVADLRYFASVFGDRPGLRRQLARALYRTGRQVEALQVLRDAADEFADDPSMRQLATAILRQDDEGTMAEAVPLRRHSYR